MAHSDGWQEAGTDSGMKKAHTHSDALARDWDGRGHEKKHGTLKNKK